MAMKLICCLLAVALLGCLAEAQQQHQQQWSQDPKYPPPPPPPPRPQTPQVPQPPQPPSQHQKPRPPSPPQQPPWLQKPQPPSTPQQYQQPQKPQPPSTPQQYQQPRKPQSPSTPQQYAQPQKPQSPSTPQQYQQSRKPQSASTPQQYAQPQKPQSPPPPQTPQRPQQTQTSQQTTPQDTERFHTCEVAENYKIQCGVPGTTAADCQAIKCCFDGRMCYYGKSVTLQCTKDGQFILVVAKDAITPNLDLEAVSFLDTDPSCGPVGTTSVFAIFQFPVTACGTVMTEENGVIVYENKLSSSYEVLVRTYGAITRDSYFEVVFQCRYHGHSAEALIIEVDKLPPPQPVAAIGPLRVELRLANGRCTIKGCNEEEVAFTSFYAINDYPVSTVLRTPVHVEVRMLGRSDPNLVLTLGNCWATADPNPHSLPQWDLLIDGCPYQEDRYQTTLIPVDASSGLEFPSHHRRFVFKMFTFVGVGQAETSKKTPTDQVLVPLKEKVHIHCETSVCERSLANNCEPRCFRKRREIVGSQRKIYRSETTVASSGLIIISEESTE